MGILQYLTQTKEALSGGFNELKNTSGGILRFLGNNVNKFEQKKEDFYEPVPNKVRTRDVIREATELALPTPTNKAEYLQEMAFNAIPFGATTKAVKNVGKNIGKSLLNKVDDVIDPILQEARKYKSAEEFVKAQGTPLYHGTQAKFDKFESKFATDAEGRKLNLGWGKNNFYFTTKKGEALKYATRERSPEVAKLYPKGEPNVIEAFVDIKKPFNIEIEKNAERWRKVRDGYWSDGVSDFNYHKIPKGKTKAEAFVEQLKKEGYDGIIDGQEITVFSENQIKTKSQLTEIWNKANKNNADDALINEAKKYKSTEEFVKAQGTPLYHGTPQKIVGDKLTYRMKSGQDSGGIFLTDNRDIADVFSFKGKVYEVNPAIKSQVIDLTTPSGIDKVKSYIGKSYKTFEGETMIFTKGDFDIMFPNGKTDFASVSQYPELIQKIVKDNKMRGIAFYEYAGGKTGKTFQILEGDVPISK